MVPVRPFPTEPLAGGVQFLVVELEQFGRPCGTTVRCAPPGTPVFVASGKPHMCGLLNHGPGGTGRPTPVFDPNSITPNLAASSSSVGRHGRQYGASELIAPFPLPADG